jgi:hypothetical protein
MERIGKNQDLIRHDTIEKQVFLQKRNGANGASRARDPMQEGFSHPSL